MASENEPAKLLLPYLQRADELQKHEPLVAYYCRLYAMERGLNIPASERTKTTKSLLTSLMNQLEKDKRSLKLSPDDHLHLEGFALNVFAKADKQDRAGRADISTAKTFYAASIFFEILNQFGELAPDLEQKQKYAVWKAADIRKALKEGRKPVPGPPGNETGLSSPSSTQDDGGFDQINSFKDVELRHTEHNINPGPEPDPTPPPQFPDSLKRQPSTNISPSPHQFPSTDYSAHTGDYPSHDYHPARPENTTYPQPYHTQSYPQEPQHPLHHSQNYPSQEPQHPLHHSQNYPSQESQHPLHHSQNYPSQDISQNYPSQDIPSSYPNFQSYPSFSESSLPAAPSHYPSHYQGSDASYFPQSAPSTTNYAAVPQYNSSTGNGNAPDAPTTAQTYHYDSNYQVPPDKIAEAQKAARFAVGALAFDEVPVAVEHLKKALEMLTNPSTGQ